MLLCARPVPRDGGARERAATEERLDP